MGSVPGSGRCPGGGHGNPLQYSYLEDPMDEEPGGLQPIGSQRVRHDWSDLAHTHKERHEDDKGLFFIYGAGTWRSLLIPLLPRAPSLISEPSFRFLLRLFQFSQILLINSVFTCINHCLFLLFSSVQLLSRVHLFATPWTAAHQARPVHQQLPEFTQTHVHWVGDAIQSSHPLLSSSPPAFNLSQQQSLFKWVSLSHQVARALEFQLQHQSFQRIFRTDFL